MLLFPLMTSGWVLFLAVFNGFLAHSGADGGDRECSHRAGLLQGRLPCEAGSAGRFHVLTLFFLLIVLTLVLLMRSIYSNF